MTTRSTTLLRATLFETSRHRQDGSIDVTEDTGIVFVLIPGGTGHFMAQRDDPAGPNYDPMAPPGSQVMSRPMQPYFLARHELTQGQWLRLSGHAHPCFMAPGSYGEPGPPDLRHPVERVSWLQANELLTSHGLAMPTRLQWSFAARAKAGGTWFFGSDLRQLPRYENTGDATYALQLRRAGYPHPGSPIDDGYYVHAPVGSFLPNPHGLFDVQGNVCEWTSTPASRPRPGESPAEYWVCGGSWQSAPQFTRLAHAEPWNPDYTMGTIGVRAARALQ